MGKPQNQGLNIDLIHALKVQNVRKAQRTLSKQMQHSCSNADTCQMGSKLCGMSAGTDVSQMSNRIRYNNMMMLQELAQLDRLDQRFLNAAGNAQDEDINRQMNDVSKELIKLQQKMKQIVTTKEERYIELRFNEWTKCVLVEETDMYLKLDLLGAESPVVFTCEIIDNAKADVKMYLSTVHKEPS
mgnify:CR=1 FL=1